MTKAIELWSFILFHVSSLFIHLIINTLNLIIHVFDIPTEIHHLTLK